MQIHAIEQLGNGVTVAYTDMGAIYTANGRQFEVAGEYDSGEAWLDGWHYCYAREESTVELTDADTGELVHVFEDTDAGWADFALTQLSK